MDLARTIRFKIKNSSLVGILKCRLGSNRHKNLNLEPQVSTFSGRHRLSFLARSAYYFTFHFSPWAPTEMIFLMTFVKTMFRKCVLKRDVKSPRFMSASRIFQVGKFLCYCKLSHVKNVNHKLVQPQNTFFSFGLLKSPKALLDIEVF